MITVLAAVAAILGLTLFSMFLRFYSVRRWGLELYPDEIHYAETSDGWKIALSRYRPAAPSGREPVILCHGLGANHTNMDFGDRLSLAKYLRARGFDAWCVDLRGVGLSSRPRWFSRWRFGYSFDDFVQKDVPAILGKVTGITGAGKVFWVGHSMGGMLGYVFLQGELAAKVRGFVAVASPPEFVLNNWALRLFNRFTRIVFIGSALRNEFLSRCAAPFIGILPRSILRALANPDNMNVSLLKQAAVNLSSDISGGVYRQFAFWVGKGHIKSSDGSVDYTEGMKAITTPSLMISGGADMLAVPEVVEKAYELVSSPDKTYRCFSAKDGASTDYGHGDILISEKALAEVYPFIAEWIEARAGK